MNKKYKTFLVGRKDKKIKKYKILLIWLVWINFA